MVDKDDSFDALVIGDDFPGNRHYLLRGGVAAVFVGIAGTGRLRGSVVSTDDAVLVGRALIRDRDGEGTLE